MRGRDFYLWQVQSFTVQVGLDFVDNLNRALSDPRQKAHVELGGILLGRIISPQSVELTDFEFIESDHHRGTIFALGLRERDRAIRRIARLGRKSRIYPVGFFRTHLRPGLYLDQDDFALMTDGFADPSQIALLIRPAEPGSANAGIFVWDGGDMDRRQTPLAFPFDSETLRVQGPVELEEKPPAPARPVPVVPVVKVRLKPIPVSVLRWPVAAAAAVAAIAAGVEYGGSLSAVHSASVVRPVIVRERPQRQLVRSDPDTKAAALTPAPAGVLTFHDDAPTQQPVTGHTQPDESTAKPVLKAEKAPEPVPPPAQPSPSPLTPEPKPEPAHPFVIARSTPPPPVLRPERVLVAEAPPLIPLAAAPEPRVMARVDALPALPPPTPPTHTHSVAVSVSVEPKESSEIRRVVGHMLFLGHAEGGSNFSPARPNRSLEPQVPELVAEDLSHEVSVDVKVSIGKDGLVRNAEVLNGGKSDLANLAAGRAGSTSWEPARQGERYVPSDVIVHYHFSPRQ